MNPLNSPVDIAFVTVNYNTRTLLEQLIRFFAVNSFPFSYQLIVVDNCSTDGSTALLKNPVGFTAIRNTKNAGYGKAINQGIAASSSRYICVLNTDLILSDEALTGLWEYMEANLDVGVVAPLVCDPGTLKLQHFYFHESIFELYSTTLFRLRSKLIRRKLVTTRSPVQTEGIMGPFLFLRRNICPDNILYDEDFDFYYEDTDLAHRLKQRGVISMILPRYSIIHLGGQSSSHFSSFQVFTRSRYRYLVKHFSKKHARYILWLERLRSRGKLLKYLVKNYFVRTGYNEERIRFLREICREFEKYIFTK